MNSGTGGQLAERDALVQTMLLVGALVIAAAGLVGTATAVARARATR